MQRQTSGVRVITSLRTRSVGTLIVGQGLAGTALAWELERRGESYLVVDERRSPTSSQVAAGLITPVTGKRFTIAEHFDELCAHASEFYRFVEACLSCRFYKQQPALRLLYGDETSRFEGRADALLESGHAHMVQVTRQSYRGEPVAFEMPGAARLVTGPYLDASYEFFRRSNRILEARVHPDAATFTDRRVCMGESLPAADRVIFCGGYQDLDNRWLPKQLFNPAKGEILTVAIPGLQESRTVHAFKSWLCPTAQSTYVFGSTYEHGDFVEQTTASARDDLENRLRQLLDTPFEVIDHHYGVRPIAVQRKAIIGCHPDEPRIGWLNGLGSKGALLAPYLAARLADAVLSDRNVEVTLTGAHVSHAR